MNPHNGQDRESNVKQVLRAALSFVKTKIITNENDKFGIILFGVANNESNKNQLNLKNIHVMCPLGEPDAGLIKHLETKLHNFTEEYGCFDDGTAKQNEGDESQIISSNVNDTLRSPLVEALWICH